MKKVYYRKLIRDKVPANMEQKGVKFKVKTLGLKKFEKALIAKPEEEARGVRTAETHSEFLDELADLIIAIEAIKKLRRIRKIVLNAAIQSNLARKGGFERRLWLEWSADNGYKTNEKIKQKRKKAR